MFNFIKHFADGYSDDTSKLYNAIAQQQHLKLLALIVSNPALVNMSGGRKLTPLMDAVLSKNYEAMRLLIRHGANVNHVDADGWTAKSWAIFIQDRTAQRILARNSILTNSVHTSGTVFGAMSLA
jgi:ankyrin repeat protein